MRQIAFLLLLGSLLPGCVTNDFAAVPKASQIGELGAENKGVVILYTSMHARGCQIVRAKIGTRDSSGRYTSVEDYSLNSTLSFTYLVGGSNRSMPVEIAMPAGHYGIVGLDCSSARVREHFNAKVTEKRDIVTGFGNIYERPLATFEVRAGEIVDLGMLIIGNTRPSTDRSVFGPKIGTFSAGVGPIPEAVLKNFEQNKPDMYKARVTRLMVTPAPAPQ